MPDSRERELIEHTSSRKLGHQVRDGVAIPQLHSSLSLKSCKKKRFTYQAHDKQSNQVLQEMLQAVLEDQGVHLK